jgi:glycosyltransferase involved in cell wall biosynthesis
METSNSSTLTVSVIVPTRNEEQVISEGLNSVFNQSFKPSEVIVVDGRSTDNTIKVASKFPVKILTESEPTSLPNARNLGAKNATGDIIFIMDADIILDKHCIRNAVSYFSDPNVMAVVPSEHNIAHTKLEKIQMDWNYGAANPFRPGLGISAFAIFLRKPVFTTLNFDPSLGYGEDEDFRYRLKAMYKGPKNVIHSSDCSISVHCSHTLKELKSQYSWYGRTFKTFMNKNYFTKTLLNFGSLIAPTALLVFGLLSVIFVQAFPFFLILAVLITARNLLVCYSS